MAGFRVFLSSSNGRKVAIGLVVLGVAAAGYSLWMNLRPSELEEEASNRLFIDAKTGKTFRMKLHDGMTYPVPAPSGGNTGYVPELCYWTKDGNTKEEPTYVVLNKYKGEPEPTFCPDCGRLVRVHNPGPITGQKPPPTKEEFNARR